MTRVIIDPVPCRKSQVSLFAILGMIIILGIISTIVILNSGDAPTDVKIIASENLDRDTVTRLVDGCLLKTEPMIRDIIKQGGEYDPANEVLFNGRNYTYWCLQAGNRGCVNQVYSTKKLENELNIHLRSIVDSCLNFSEYETIGYQIDLSPSTLQSSVGIMDLTLYYNLPMKISKEGEEFELSDFSYRFDIAAGRLYQIANHILNEEIENDYFDKDSAMLNLSSEIRIEKHKTYPDTVYHLNRWNDKTQEWLELNFAIQGIDTIADLSKDYYKNLHPGGECKSGNICFFNPVGSDCEPITDHALDCPNPFDISYPGCVGDGCEPCGDYANGEEWCEYDGLTGDGRDFVGTRHYLKSCIDGYIYTEECRDYREEICVESTGDALCRPNRWKTCMEQDNSIDCLDTTERDCSWYNYTDTFNKTHYPGNERIMCVPSVSPGFQYWSGMGADVCQMGNEWIDCDGASCPQQWSETSMLQCKRLGDCGFGYTVNGVIGNISFTTTDRYDHPQGTNFSSLYGPEYLGYSAETLTVPPFDFERESFNNNVFDCDDCTLNDLLDRVSEYIDYLDSLDMEDLMLEYVMDGDVGYHTRHLTLCMPFMPVERGNCDECYDPYKPCTEYKCRSMGSSCSYFVNDAGYGDCMEIDATGDPPVILSETVQSRPYNVLTDAMFSADVFGKALDDSVTPFSKITVSFNTSKPTQCTKSPIPISRSQIPFDLDFTSPTHESGFSFEHEFTLYAIPSEYLLNQINKLVDLTNYFEVYSPDVIGEKLDGIIENLTEVAEDADDFGVSQSDIDAAIQQLEDIKQYYEDDIAPQVEAIYTSLGSIINIMLNSLDNNQVNTFFNCVDEYGVDNTELFFFRFTIQEDIYPPEPLDIRVLDDRTNNPNIELEVIMNEPVECRADFDVNKLYEDMDYEMDCEDGYLAAADGYRCFIQLAKNPAACNPDNTGDIYFRCRDQTFESDLTKVNINDESLKPEYGYQCVYGYYP
ncbi:hypothetical protein H6503_03790 [Candidatus Woesearchaeota archaeon]|nr:hypothetical protein [Candidatus Woesearchaeota archaeon]